MRLPIALLLLVGCDREPKELDRDRVQTLGCEDGQPPGAELLAIAREEVKRTRRDQELLFTMASRCVGALEAACAALRRQDLEARRETCARWREYARFLMEEGSEIFMDCKICGRVAGPWP